MKALRLAAALLLAGCTPKPASAPSVGPPATAPRAADQAAQAPTAPQRPRSDASALAEAVALIPDGADTLIAVDATKAVRSEVGGLVLDALEAQRAPFLEAARGCGVGPQAWRFAVFGQQGDSADASLGVFSADGLGRESTLQCLADQVHARTPQTSFTVAREGDRVVARGPGQTIISVSEHVVAVPGASWQQAFEGRIDHSLAPASASSLREPLGLVDTSQAVYFVSNGTNLQERFEFVTGGVAVTRGVAISISLYSADASKTQENAQFVREQFVQLKGVAPMLGIPTSIVEQVQIESRGRAVHMHARATSSEVGQILDRIDQQTP